MPSTEFGGEQIQTSFFDYSEEDRLLIERRLINFDLPAIDVGSGGSNRVVDPRRQGLSIFGIDPLYTDPQSVGDGIVGVAFWAMVDNDSYWFDRQNAASKAFDASLKPRSKFLRKSYVPYVAGSADSLPVADGSTSTVLDSKLSLSYLADKPDSLASVLTEYRRVLTQDGVIALSGLAALDTTSDHIDGALIEQLSERWTDVEQELVESRDIVRSVCTEVGLRQVTKLDTVFEGGPRQGEHKSSTLVLEKL